MCCPTIADVTNTFQPNLTMLNPAIEDILDKLEPMEGRLVSCGGEGCGAGALGCPGVYSPQCSSLD